LIWLIVTNFGRSQRDDGCDAVWFELTRRDSDAPDLGSASPDACSAKETDSMVSTVPSWDVGARDCEPGVVWLYGEEDIATVAVLADTLARVVSADAADVIVDLSGVTFLSTATIEELIRVRNILWLQNRNLTLRSPSRCARRLLDVCGLPLTSAA
jgi:anti-anti-sigma factor